jgi:S1-C subfamily serine protease
MKLFGKFLFVFKSTMLGLMAGFLILFFIPNSPIGFNWHEAQQAWSFYLEQKQPKNPSDIAGEFSYSAAVSKAGPSVVSVKAFRQGRARKASDGRKGDMLVDISIGVGSGVIFNTDGYIVTNYHVVAGSFRVAVHFSDGRKELATLVGFDQPNDIAVLKVDIKTPRAAELGNSSEVKTGDVALAIGTPFGLFENSVTLGIVSAVNHGPLYPRIQTDASINYGNSGGALINARGQVIGINSSKFSVEANDEIGISFAAPIEVVKETFDDIIKHGRVVRNWLGLSLNQLNRAGHSHFDPGAEFGKGLLVTSIEEGSPSAEAGVLQEDFLLKFDGHVVESMIQMRKLFIALPIGKEIEIELLRNKQLMKMKLQLREKPSL